MEHTVRTTEEWFQDAFDQGLAPMALRLIAEGITFTVGGWPPPGEPVMLHIPLTPHSHLLVASAENSPGDDLEDLRWHVWLRRPTSVQVEEDEDAILGDCVSTEDAIDVIADELNKAKNRG